MTMWEDMGMWLCYDVKCGFGCRAAFNGRCILKKVLRA